MYFKPDGEQLQDFILDLSNIRYRKDAYQRAFFALETCSKELDKVGLTNRHDKARALENLLINALSSNLAKPDVEELRGDIERLEMARGHIEDILRQAYRVLDRHTQELEDA